MQAAYFVFVKCRRFVYPLMSITMLSLGHFHSCVCVMCVCVMCVCVPTEQLYLFTDISHLFYNKFVSGYFLILASHLALKR